MFLKTNFIPLCSDRAKLEVPTGISLQCHMYRGVHPLQYKEPRQGDWTDDVEKRFIAGIEIGKKGGYIGKWSSIIMVSGWRPGPHHINTIRIFVVGE